MAISEEELFKLTLGMFSLNYETAPRTLAGTILELFKQVQIAHKQFIENQPIGYDR